MALRPSNDHESVDQSVLGDAERLPRSDGDVVRLALMVELTASLPTEIRETIRLLLQLHQGSGPIK